MVLKLKAILNDKENRKRKTNNNRRETMKETGKHNMIITSAIWAAVLGLGLTTQAAVIASYDFTGGSASATSADANVTAGE